MQILGQRKLRPNKIVYVFHITWTFKKRDSRLENIFILLIHVVCISALRENNVVGHKNHPIQ